MPIIKRYPNRKLYDTQAKQYITLEGIATLIRQGEDVEVVDYATGEDLTALTLSQIILDQEKKKGGFVPSGILSGLVKAGATLTALQHNFALPLSFSAQVEDEIARRIQALVDRGELTEQEGLRLRQKLTDQGHQAYVATHPTEADLERALGDRGVPTHDDFQRLLKQVEALASELDELDRHKGPATASTRRSRRTQHPAG